MKTAIKYSCSIILIFMGLQSISQPYGAWEPIPIADAVSTPGELIYSENLGLLVYTGFFQRPDGSRYLAGYDGNDWQHVLDFSSAGGGIRAMSTYEDGILLCAVAECGVGTTLPYISYFDGEMEYCPWEFNDLIRKLEWINDTLYAIGTFTEIDGIPAYYAARLIDGVWEGLLNPNLDMGAPLFYDIENFEGKLYVAGNFQSDDWPQDLATIEDGELVQVGPGLVGSWTSVGKLNVFNGELYISGGIAYSQGNIGNHIVKWDGEAFSQVGELFSDQQGQFSTAGSISDVFVLGDYLYVGGSFGFIGDEEIALFARWDGTQWCSMEAENFGAFTYRCNKLGNEIVRFVFNVILENGEFNPFWKMDVSGYNPSVCNEPLSVSEIDNVSFEIFPNPASTTTTIQAPTMIQELILHNSLGQTLQRLQAFSERIELDLSGLAAGMYFVEVQTEQGFGVEKLVVE